MLEGENSRWTVSDVKEKGYLVHFVQDVNIISIKLVAIVLVCILSTTMLALRMR